MSDDGGVASLRSQQQPNSYNLVNTNNCHTMLFSTTIVFACKSNSCRSQMAEAWAKEWIKAERKEIESRRLCVVEKRDGSDGDDDIKLRAFVDGLFIASVALDETCVGTATTCTHSSTGEMERNEYPTSSLTTTFECETCNGDVCSLSARRRHPKEKAVRAMAQDGVDISDYEVKSFQDIYPALLGHHHRGRSNGSNCLCTDRIIDMTTRNWRSQLLLPNLRHMLQIASREMGMAFAGIARNSIANEEKEETQSYVHGNNNISVAQNSGNKNHNSNDVEHVVDNLIVLCSCPDSMTRPLAELSRELLNWDVDPPSTAAITEGDLAFVRVSRQIRRQVNEFMNQLKSCALMTKLDQNKDGVKFWKEITSALNY